MPARAYWTGRIRMSLVSFGVELYTAISQRDVISFRQIHKPTGERVRYEKVVPEVGPVDNEDIVKGYEYEKGRYVLIEPDEIDELKIESSDTIELVQFVERGEIDPLYFERPYYVVPDSEAAEEAFCVVRDALRESGKVALGEVAMRGREYLISIRPCGRGMLLETMRYENEIREAKSYFAEIGEPEVSDEEIELAQQLIDRKTKPFDASKFEDDYQSALRELIDAKLEDREPEIATGEAEGGGKVINLMDALKRSVGETEGKGGGRKSGKSDGKSASSGKSKSSGKSGGSKSGGSKSSGKSGGAKSGGGKSSSGQSKAASGDGRKRKSA